MESAQLTVADKAIEILRQTRDGDTLEPRDLKLVEMAVNDFLNEDGKPMDDLKYSALEQKQ